MTSEKQSDYSKQWPAFKRQCSDFNDSGFCDKSGSSTEYSEKSCSTTSFSESLNTGRHKSAFSPNFSDKCANVDFKFATEFSDNSGSSDTDVYDKSQAYCDQFDGYIIDSCHITEEVEGPHTVISCSLSADIDRTEPHSLGDLSDLCRSQYSVKWIAERLQEKLTRLVNNPFSVKNLRKFTKSLPQLWRNSENADTTTCNEHQFSDITDSAGGYNIISYSEYQACDLAVDNSNHTTSLQDSPCDYNYQKTCNAGSKINVTEPTMVDNQNLDTAGEGNSSYCTGEAVLLGDRHPVENNKHMIVVDSEGINLPIKPSSQPVCMAGTGSEDWQVIDVHEDSASAWCYSYCTDAQYSDGLISIPLQQLETKGSRSNQPRSRLNQSNVEDVKNKRTDCDPVSETDQSDCIQCTKNEHKRRLKESYLCESCAKTFGKVTDGNLNYKHLKSANNLTDTRSSSLSVGSDGIAEVNKERTGALSKRKPVYFKQKLSVDSGIDTDNQDNNAVAKPSKHKPRLRRIKEKQLQLIDKRKVELAEMIDRWHEHITMQVEDAYLKEEDRLITSDSDAEDVNELIMSSMLTTENGSLPTNFGSFQVHHALRKHMPALASDYWAYQLGPAEHSRTFETRDTTEMGHMTHNTYMCSSLHLTPSGDILVADLGADTCRLYTREGRLSRELDTYPFDEPTHAISYGGGYLLSCRDGLKCFSIQGKYVETIADVKCPQCVGIDAKKGHVVVSDMHDCGTVIVTLHRDSLVPIRLMCGSQYEGEAAFQKAWHLHVTSDNKLLLTDRQDHTLKAYAMDNGNFLWSVGGQGSKPEQLFNPAGISEDFLGNILVADGNNDRVQMWSGDGQWLGVVLNEEQISNPMDVVTDDSGNIYVLQGDGKVVVFKYLSEL